MLEIKPSDQHLLRKLSADDYVAVGEVLEQAFQLDPAFVALFKSLPPGNARAYRTFMQIWAQSSFRLGHDVFGLSVDGLLAGVVGVTPVQPPKLAPWLLYLPKLPTLLWGMQLSVGLSLSAAVRRPHQVTSATPEISMLAVRPDMQGKGVATTLLNAAHSTILERGDREVYLYTTARGSRSFYEKQGYELVEAARAFCGDVFHLVRKL